MSWKAIGCGVAVVLVWMTASVGTGTAGDGNELLENCTDALRHVENEYRFTGTDCVFHYGWCVGYMRGWVDGTMGGATLCVPQKVTALQLVRIIVKYLRDHPQTLHHSRDTLITTALQEAYPCPTRGRDLTDELYGPAPRSSQGPSDAELLQMGLPAAPTPTPQPGTPPAPPAPSKKRQR
jgi:hypothetical protein